MPQAPRSTPALLPSSPNGRSVLERVKERLEPEVAALYDRAYIELEEQYGPRPQYVLLAEQAALFQALLWWLAPKVESGTFGDRAFFSRLGALARGVIEQLQRHTESVKVDVREWQADFDKYARAVEMVLDEIIADPALRDRFHERLSELVFGAAWQAAPPALPEVPVPVAEGPAATLFGEAAAP